MKVPIACTLTADDMGDRLEEMARGVGAGDHP